MCLWRWNGRWVDDIPKKCPHCHTIYWMKEKTETRGRPSRIKGDD